MAARLLSLDCTPASVPSLGALRDRLGEAARQAPPGVWLRGWGYDETALAERRYPTRYDLDAVAPHNPVRLTHRSGHAAVLNSLALEAVGIRRETPDPPGGAIDRDEHGEPTGLLLEMGAYLADRVPRLAPDDLERGVREANAWLLSRGVTAVQDASPDNDLSRLCLLTRMVDNGLLVPRLTFMPGVRNLDEFQGESAGCRPRLGHAKIMLTASTGALSPSPEELEAMVREAVGRGYPVAVHCVEAAAVRAAADVLGRVRPQEGSAAPHRIEHASELPPEALEAVRSSGAMVVTNPGFIHFNGERYLRTVPAEEQPGSTASGRCTAPASPWPSAPTPPSRCPSPWPSWPPPSPVGPAKAACWALRRRPLQRRKPSASPSAAAPTRPEQAHGWAPFDPAWPPTSSSWTATPSAANPRSGPASASWPPSWAGEWPGRPDPLSLVEWAGVRAGLPLQQRIRRMVVGKSGSAAASPWGEAAAERRVRGRCVAPGEGEGSGGLGGAAPPKQA